MIMVGAIVAVLLDIVVIYRVVISDRPHPVNEAPKNVVGTSEKAYEMKRQQAGGQATAPAAAGGGGGDDVMPAMPK
jgi:hypothetical protein